MMRAAADRASNAPRQFKSGHGRKIDIDHTDIRLLSDKNALTSFGVRRFQDHDILIAEE